MSVKTNTSQAIKHHLSGIEKIKNGALDWIACGECLIKIKTELTHGEYIPYIKSNLPFSNSQASRYVRFAKQGPALLEVISNQDGSLSQNEALKLLPAASSDDMGYVGSITSNDKSKRDSDNWHTPDDVVQAARNVMGSINLDPFSSAEANTRIKADKFYTKEDDALTLDWEGDTVFINPPYGRGVMPKAADKIIEQYQAGSFKQGILLMNNTTDTTYFHKLRRIANAVCFTEGRIAFVSPAEDGVMKQVSGNTRGQVLFYFGNNVQGFMDAYHDLGWCMEVKNG